MPSLIKTRDKEDHADSLAIKLPDGLLYAGKYIDNTVIRRWLIGTGLTYLRLEDRLNYAINELSLTNTNDLITEWESEYAISSSCFNGGDSIELSQRIQNILTLISANGTSTAQQFEDLAELLGLDVTVTAGQGTTFPMTFPFSFVEERESRFTINVEFNSVSAGGFPYTFPINFGNNLTSVAECLFNHLKPANCIINFIYNKIDNGLLELIDGDTLELINDDDLDLN